MRYLFFLLLFPVILTAQSDQGLVRLAIQDYLDGTSYNRPELLERAFHPAISMYFTKNDSLWQPSRAEYIGFFSKAEPGTFSGRLGKILNVEMAGDVAMAKAEVFFVHNGFRFVDYFLLKRHAGEWTIISKTAHGAPSNRNGERILIVGSNATRYGDTELPTANHFGELTHAYHVFNEAGYSVDFISPLGGPLALSYLDQRDSLDRMYLADADVNYQLRHTLAAGTVRGENYRAIYFPGGGAAMFGVADNPDVKRLIREVYENNGSVGAVCHGTAGITGVKLSDGLALVNGRRITGFPDAMERQDAPYYATFPFHITERVTAGGGDFVAAESMNEGFFVVDDRIVTGMDHSATIRVAKEMVKLLQRSHDNR